MLQLPFTTSHKRLFNLFTKLCDQAFQLLKDLFTTASVLAYPQFQNGASAFILHTDNSYGGMGAVLEQDGRVVASASQALTQSERN